MEDWQPIATAPKDSTIIDLWCGKYNERLTNYRRVVLSSTNIFYDPEVCGRCCVRSATYWMPIPKPPKRKDND